MCKYLEMFALFTFNFCMSRICPFFNQFIHFLHLRLSENTVTLPVNRILLCSILYYEYFVKNMSHAKPVSFGYLIIITCSVCVCVFTVLFWSQGVQSRVACVAEVKGMHYSDT